MSFTSAVINDSSSSGLPSLTWQRTGSGPVTITSGETVVGHLFSVKVPRVPQELIDEGKLYVQYGRISYRDYTNRPVPRVRPTRIKWWSSWDGNIPEYTGTGELGGGHTGVAIGVARPNMFQVTVQNMTAPDLPYWAFYRTGPVDVLTAEPGTNGYATITGVPYVTGNKRRSDFNTPDFFLPGGPLYTRRPQRPMWRRRNHSTSYWFARLVIVEDGLVTAYGPESGPVVIRPNELPFSEHYMASAVPDINGDKAIPQYSFTEFRGEIQTKYRA